MYSYAAVENTIHSTMTRMMMGSRAMRKQHTHTGPDLHTFPFLVLHTHSTPAVLSHAFHFHHRSLKAKNRQDWIDKIRKQNQNMKADLVLVTCERKKRTDTAHKHFDFFFARFISAWFWFWCHKIFRRQIYTINFNWLGSIQTPPPPLPYRIPRTQTNTQQQSNIRQKTHTKHSGMPPPLNQ